MDFTFSTPVGLAHRPASTPVRGPAQGENDGMQDEEQHQQDGELRMQRWWSATSSAETWVQSPAPMRSDSAAKGGERDQFNRWVAATHTPGAKQMTPMSVTPHQGPQGGHDAYDGDGSSRRASFGSTTSVGLDAATPPMAVFGGGGKWAPRMFPAAAGAQQQEREGCGSGSGSARSANMSVAASEIDGALAKLKLREQHAGSSHAAVAQGAGGQDAVADRQQRQDQQQRMAAASASSPADDMLVMSGGGGGAAAGLAPVLRNGVFVPLTAARPAAVGPTPAPLLPPCSPIEAVLSLMADPSTDAHINSHDGDGDGDEEVQPLQLRFEDGASAAAAGGAKAGAGASAAGWAAKQQEEDESDDEVPLDALDLSMLTPIAKSWAGRVGEAGGSLVGGGGITPLSQLLALMTSPQQPGEEEGGDA